MGAVYQGTQRLSTFAGQTTLEVEVCTCGVLFAAPKHMLETRREDGKSFYCPNGHCLSYDGEISRLKRRAEQAEQKAKATRDLLDFEQRSNASTRGHLTRMKKRVAGGVCPCCNRSFKDLAKHMAGQHPDFTKAAKKA